MSEQAVEMAIGTPEMASVERVPPGTPGAGKGGIIPPKEHRIRPGEVRNPNGRRLSAAIEAKLAEAGRPERLVESIMAKIEKEADVPAFKEIISRHEGHVAHEVQGSVTVMHKVIFHEGVDDNSP